MTREEQIKNIERNWEENPRWKNITRTYSATDVLRLRGSVKIEHTIAKLGAERLWDLMNENEYVNASGFERTGLQSINEQP